MSNASKTAARLLVLDSGVRRTIFIDPIPFMIGRSPERHLALNHPQISREHASIHRDADGYWLHDLSSRHGTLVNGLAISSTRLRTGDRIVLGGASTIGVSTASSTTNELVFEEAPIDDLTVDSSTRSLLVRLTGSGSGAQSPLTAGSSSDLETLSLFLQAAQSLNSFGAARDVLQTMLDYTLKLTGAERGFVFLGDSQESLTLACSHIRAGADAQVLIGEGSIPIDISRSVLKEAAESQLEFILSDIEPQAALADGRTSLVLHSIRSVVAIPLRTQQSAKLLGLLYLDSHSSTQTFTQIGKATIQTIARQAATLLENLRMMEAEQAALLLRKELEIAATIQRQIIPETLPTLPGVHLTARTLPCTSVGGDFYDVIPTANGFVALIGDVCGKGIPAALLAAMVQGMIHAQVTAHTTGQKHEPPQLADLVTSANKFVCSRAPVDKYLTLAILRYTHPLADAAGEPALIELINGGHVAPILVHADGRVETIEGGDLPVGLFGFATYTAINLAMSKGDRLVLLSDGITEAEDKAGVQFGEEKLPACLRLKMATADPTAELFATLDSFCCGVPPQDDQTVLTIERTV